MAGLPARTGGRVILKEDGTTVFRYRRWGILDDRSVPLPTGTRHIVKGIFSPSLVQQTSEREESKLLLFLPRYRGHESSIARHLKLHSVREHPITRNFSAVKEWLKGMLQGKETEQKSL
jgi:hypothetical protein